MSTIYVALSVSLQECFSISELTVKKNLIQIFLVK